MTDIKTIREIREIRGLKFLDRITTGLDKALLLSLGDAKLAWKQVVRGTTDDADDTDELRQDNP